MYDNFSLILEIDKKLGVVSYFSLFPIPVRVLYTCKKYSEIFK